MSGLEAVASAAGLISLSLTLFKGCIQAFQFAETTANLGGDGDIIRCKLEWEQYRLYQWGERVGLESRPHRNLNWPLAADILKQLEKLLTDSKDLKGRYNLDVASISKNALEGQDFAITSARKASFGLLLTKLRPNYTQASSRIIQESNAPFKKLEWAAIGKEKLQKLVEDISYFNNCLHSLLETSDRDFITESLAALLRDIISRSNVISELDVIKELLQSTSVASSEAVASAASLKRIRLILGLGKSGVEAQRPNKSSNLKLKLKYLKPKYLIRESMHTHPVGREIACYKSGTVLVEWRFMKTNTELQARHNVDQLAILLGNTNEGFFHSLHCIGVMPKDSAFAPADNAYVAYGLVFNLERSRSAPSTLPTLMSLSNIYAKSRRPSLNERLCIALAVAETVLQLHTTGWLHKGIRPDNVLFLAADSQGWETRTVDGPFLAGYEFARPSIGETETVPSQPNLDIYRHPSTQGPARSNFRRAFDLFALGCILLEIALWRCLRDILLQASDKMTEASMDEKHGYSYRKDSYKLSGWNRVDAAKERLLLNGKKEDLVELAFYAGETFRDAVFLCFHPLDDDEPDDEGLDTQRIVVESIRRCGV